jgi:hypothetical protein
MALSDSHTTEGSSLQPQITRAIEIPDIAWFETVYGPLL